VTELEIRLGFLANQDQQARRFFYFREPLPYDSMPRDVATLYSDAHDRDPEAGERAKKLAALKREIEQALPGRVRSYTADWDKKRQVVTNLEAWGQRVLEDIWSEILATSTETQEQVSWQEIERTALNDYIEDRARGFIGRTEILSRLLSFATPAGRSVVNLPLLGPKAKPIGTWTAPDLAAHLGVSVRHDGQTATSSLPSREKHNDAWGICITGPAGSGKSALFGEFKRRLTKKCLQANSSHVSNVPASGATEAGGGECNRNKELSHVTLHFVRKTVC
jgi:hypothetical protein